MAKSFNKHFTREDRWQIHENMLYIIVYSLLLSSRSVVSDSLWPMDCSTPGFPVPHHLPEFAQNHVHWVSDAIQPSRPLSPPSPALNLFQHQDLFQWVSSSHKVAKVLELWHQCFQWIFRVDFLYDWLIWSCCSRESQEFSSAPQFEGINSLVLSLLYSQTLTSINDCWKNHSFHYLGLWWQSDVFAF